MQCVLPNTILKKCPSEHNVMCPYEHIKMCPYKHPPQISSKTYPYPKGEHNGAVGPKYASCLKVHTLFGPTNPDEGKKTA